jgi:hypothetical protein
VKGEEIYGKVWRNNVAYTLYKSASCPMSTGGSRRLDRVLTVQLSRSEIEYLHMSLLGISRVAYPSTHSHRQSSLMDRKPRAELPLSEFVEEC